jgi:hypothetical protein
VEESGCNCGEIMEIGPSSFQDLWIEVNLTEGAANNVSK